MRPWTGAALLIVLSVLMADGARAGDGEPASGYDGMRLAEALARLQSEGLKIIYSSDLVRPAMLVTEAPKATWPREILDELLAPHGLKVRSGPGGSLLVVKAPPGGTIRGTVRDGKDAHLLPAVEVTVNGTEVQVETDGQGRFQTSSLPAGRYSLTVAHPDYLTERFDQVPVSGGQATELRLNLTPMNVSSEEIVVTSSEDSSRSGEPEMRRHLGFEDILETPTVSSDPFRALERLPGVAVAEESARLSIRGGEANETQIILDGLELYEPFHLKDHRGLFSMIDSRGVQDVDVLEGAFPVEYGGRMSGVIDISSREFSGTTGSELAVMSDVARLAGEGPIGDGRGRWLAALRRGYPGAILDALQTDPGYDPDYYDLFGKTRIDLSDTTSITFNVLASLDNLAGEENGFAISRRGRGTFKSSYGDTYAWLNLRRTWTPDLYSQTILSAGSLAHHRSGSSAELEHVDDRRTTSLFGLKQSWVAQSARHLWKWGLDLKHLQARYDYVSIPGESIPESSRFVENRIDVDPAGEDLGVHIADRIRLLPALSVELGLRWDRQTYAQTSESTLSPRLNLVYHPGPRSEIRFGWGYFHQAQRITELQVEDGVTDFFPAQRSEHWAVGFRHHFDGGLELEAGAYRKVLTDILPHYESLFDPLAFFPESTVHRVPVAPDEGLAQGLELALRKGASGGGRLSWSASYSLASVEDELEGGSVPRTWDQRHTLRLDLGYRVNRNWKFDVAGMYHSGRPTTPVSAESVPQPDGTFQLLTTTGERNSERLPSFHRLDLGVTRSFPLQRTEIEAFFNVINVYDRRNVCCVDKVTFDLQPDGEVEIDREERYGLPRMLTYGLTWRF